MTIFRQLFDRESSTFTYLLGCPETRQALLIDPVREQVERDLRLVKELDLTLALVLETHVHADHVTGAGELRARTGARTRASAAGAACIDQPLTDGETITLGTLRGVVRATPGHTDDSLSFHFGDRLFSGDALLIRSAGRTDFQNGNAGQLYDSITAVLFALPDETQLYPAHDYQGHSVSTIGEEKRYNPRVAGKSRDEFVALMNALNLPPPKLIDVAVPANRACGETNVDKIPHGV